ncbi:hypothetical protein SAMN05421863_100296 [Nitrosomonas communis]|uniref:Uncharacterized protein n=1 Tax=Nitrosomonas communis TaxID=44574 RepID=A0A1I4JL61_9PROT|nr:hypothetical protein SAMN05421863_100296 [Nitrosomonas communis]
MTYEAFSNFSHRRADANDCPVSTDAAKLGLVLLG